MKHILILCISLFSNHYTHSMNPAPNNSTPIPAHPAYKKGIDNCTDCMLYSPEPNATHAWSKFIEHINVKHGAVQPMFSKNSLYYAWCCNACNQWGAGENFPGKHVCPCFHTVEKISDH